MASSGRKKGRSRDRPFVFTYQRPSLVAPVPLREVFRPRPNVESALVAFRRIAPGVPEGVKRLVEGAFAHRRKTLANSLALAGVAPRDAAVTALEAGCHVFVEKPLATTVADARRVVDAARANGRKLVVGYILRHHPSWMRLIAEARKLGPPYVFRMNLNQQSSGATWAMWSYLPGEPAADVLAEVVNGPPA